MLARILPLFAVIGLGALCAGLRVFPSTERAIEVLNRFALYVGFPLLIVSGLASDALVLPAGPGFYALHLVGAAGILGAAVLATLPSRQLREERGAVALGALLGNIAYLGIPFCRSALGEGAAGLASLSASIHIAIAMALGPFLLLRWSRATGRASLGETLRRVASQPLVWSPLAGLALRATPDTLRRAVLTVADPMGRAAGVVALFLLGLYLFTQRGRLLAAGTGALATTALKLGVFPALVLGAIAATASLWPLGGLERSVLVLQAGMPVAITTFALAEEYRTGRELLSCAIVLSTLLSLVTLPLLAAWAGG